MRYRPLRPLSLLPLLAILSCASAQTAPVQTGAAAPITANASNASDPSAQPTEVSGAVSKLFSVEGITEYRLPNGLRVLLYPDASKPTFTVNLTFFVGSRHEGYGESGMAHLLEHMLFKGTPTHPDIWKLLQERGANFNGTTWWDRTNYYEELPATTENLEFALALEADRMVHSRIAQEDLQKEFSVVRNEFEMNENDPDNVLEEKMFSVAYQWHNYGKSTIGSRSDIEKVPADKLRAFYAKYYQPDNAMLIVAGKFDAASTLALVTREFGAIPKPGRVLERTYTEEPVQDGERQVTLRRTGDIAVVGALYHAVSGPDADWLATDAISDILSNKPSGRLYKALVATGLASEVWSRVYPTAEPGVVLAGAKVRPGGSPEKVQKVLLETIEGLGQTKIEDAEVERWRTASLKNFELALTDTSAIGVALSDWAAMGDWRLFFLARDRLDKVTAADITRVAKSFLRASNRTAGLFLPTQSPERAPAIAAPDVALALKDFKPQESVDEAESFLATIDNVEARTKRSTVNGGPELALLSKKTKKGAVRLNLTLRWGSAKELQNRRAAATLLGPMLLRGTKKHSYQALRDELDRLRAELHIGGDRSSNEQANVTTFNVLTVRDKLPAVIDLLAEILREPAFSSEEFENLRKEQLSQLEEQLQDPMANGFTTLNQRLYPWPKTDIRHVRSVQEQVEELQKLKLAELTQLYKLWGASALQIAVIGDMDPAAVEQQIGQKLGTWKSPVAYERIARPYQANEAKEDAIKTPDKQMAAVGVGQALEIQQTDPDYPALVLWNYVVGGSASSRLLNRLRQKEGLSYGAFSRLQAPPLDKGGSFLAGAICAPENADKAMHALLDELTLILKDGVTEAELADAKKSYAATWDSQLADDDFVIVELTRGLFLKRTFAFWKDINEKVQRVTAAELLAVGRKYVNPEKLAKVRAGDLDKVK
ncbi:MAG TPA: pitrilysin family protein [Polyangiales bacterium]|nr:pitrilysin family protein [Polyangiales bacterium]